MKQTIEKNVVNITVWTAITVILSVVSMVWIVADFRNDIQVSTSLFESEVQLIHSALNTRLTLVEQDNVTQKNYLYNLKSDLKADIQENNNKLNDIYDLLLKK